MITSLRLKNFKSWRELPKIRLAPITGFFGTNSSGKTSLLQLLLMLKQTTESPDRTQVLNLGDERSSVSLGSFLDVVHESKPSEALEWELSWKLPKPYQVMDPERRGTPLFSGTELTFGCEVGLGDSGRVAAQQLWYCFGGQDFRMKMKGEGKYALLPTAKQSAGFAFKRGVGRPWDLPAPIKCYGFPDQVKAYYQNADFLSDFALHLEGLAQRLHYLGPLREYPHREYTWTGAEPAVMGQRGENVVHAILASRKFMRKIGRGRGRKALTLEEYVAFWLQELDLVDEFMVKEIAPNTNLYAVHVKKSDKAAEVSITDIGFGVSQILPVVVLCYYAPEGSTVILEQPEIHLHPSVQSGLADVFVDAVTKRKVQIIVESHSEHLLRRIQRRIAEEKLSKDETALYFCEMSDGESKIRELELDLLGRITNWPSDFFADQFGEIAETQRAQLRRQLKARA